MDLPASLAQDISAAANRNLRKAIMMLQSVSLKTNCRLGPKSVVPVPEYETFVKEVVIDVFKEQTPKNLRHIRTKVYDLLTKGITPEIIFLLMVRCFMKRMDEKLKKTML